MVKFRHFCNNFKVFGNCLWFNEEPNLRRLNLEYFALIAGLKTKFKEKFPCEGYVLPSSENFLNEQSPDSSTVIPSGHWIRIRLEGVGQVGLQLKHQLIFHL